MRGIARRSWATRGIGAAGIAGLALVAAAVLLVWTANVGGPGVTGVSAADPTATATPNEDCQLKVTKSDSPDPVAEDGQITYTITVENNGDGNGSCDGIEVTDVVPDDTECVSADVTDSGDSNLDFDSGDIDDSCDDNDTVVWASDDSFDTDDSITLTMVVELTSGANDGDEISNEACATSDDDEVGDCETEKTDVTDVAATATPGPTATTAPVAPPPTARPIAPPPPIPTAVIMPILSPNTGSGPGSSSNSALALALGLTGGALVLLGGTGVWLRRRS